MSFFESLNDKFFNPFCCRNRAIYFDGISLLIEKSKEIPVLYETDARNTLILYLQNCTYSLETENIGEEIGNGRTPQENASAILRYFRACGWITPQEIGRSGDNIASVSAYCRKLIDAVHKIFDRDANGAITNHIFSMYEILGSAFGRDSARAIRPYQSILSPLIEHECDLKNELLILKDSIREIMRAVMRMADANSFGQYLIKDELLSRFFNDYFFIKKSGLIPSYISEIDRMLRKLRRSELYDRMIQEYIRVSNVGEAQAREKVERQFGELDSFINLEYDREMNYIDRKINTYYNLYSTRMMMVLSGNTNLEHQLNRLLLFLKDMDGEDRREAIDRLSQAHRLQSIGYVGRKSFERRRKRNPNLKNAGLLADDLTQEEKQRLTDELLAETPDRYSMDNVERHFASLLAGREKITVEECGAHTRDDATMIAASIIYSGTVGFPYEVEFGEGMVETEAARISRVTIKRKDRTE
ncbi:MAG TPA: chromosome segregation protein SMC [Candidatus Eisenbergiella merdigallinarum]|uniref:Chromosome segregation protein SMC n=1 Tax=Candidatus Eisenbergiella merdigallinarum TaxID=2838552 RepID=A0A9D2MSW1_9FIRM|nr:chromosome segregation protein SMC [Candidatus Eisenbergiella merdigallinarum]